MLKIEKVEKPGFFGSWIKNEEGCNQALREYILEKEQQHVCCYCEKKVTAYGETSHIEHIRPRDKFPQLKNAYNNLSVSCQIKGRCGHAKGNTFNEYFIIPTEENPGDYLTYSLNGEMRPIDNNQKGRETIEILNLNAPKLIGARKVMFIQLHEMKNSPGCDDFEKHFNEYPTLITYFKENYLNQA